MEQSAVISRTHERRAHPRRRVLKRVKIMLNGNRSVVDGTMRDLSPGGARLACDQAGLLPQRFVLILVAEREMREVRVAWRSLSEVGVQFLSPPRKAFHLLI